MHHGQAVVGGYRNRPQPAQACRWKSCAAQCLKYSTFSTSSSSMRSPMPRYWPSIAIVVAPLPALAHHHRRRGRRVGPTEIGADLDILDLPTAALAVIVGVL